MLSAWPWLMLAALVILPVILRIFAGDDPRNEITHESGDEDRDEVARLAVREREDMPEAA